MKIIRNKTLFLLTKKHFDECHFVLDFLKCHSACTKIWEKLFIKKKNPSAFWHSTKAPPTTWFLTLECERTSILKTLLRIQFICFASALSVAQRSMRGAELLSSAWLVWKLCPVSAFRQPWGCQGLAGPEHHASATVMQEPAGECSLTADTTDTCRGVWFCRLDPQKYACSKTPA